MQAFYIKKEQYVRALYKKERNNSQAWISYVTRNNFVTDEHWEEREDEPRDGALNDLFIFILLLNTSSSVRSDLTHMLGKVLFSWAMQKQTEGHNADDWLMEVWSQMHVRWECLAAQSGPD